ASPPGLRGAAVVADRRGAGGPGRRGLGLLVPRTGAARAAAGAGTGGHRRRGRAGNGVRLPRLSANLYLCSQDHDRGGCMTFSPRALLPTPTKLRLAIVPVLAFLATVTDRTYLADFWHHLARGRAMVERGGLVDGDLFTFTVAGQPTKDINWLTQVGYYY